MKLTDGEKLIWATTYARARSRLDREASIQFAHMEIEALREDVFDLTPSARAMFNEMVMPLPGRLR